MRTPLNEQLFDAMMNGIELIHDATLDACREGRRILNSAKDYLESEAADMSAYCVKEN